MKVLTWRGLDEPRMEIAYVESWKHAHGTQIGRDYELRWRLAGPRLGVELVGAEAQQFELGDADFFDLWNSPFFNSLPVARDGLLDGGDPREYVMRFIEHPPLRESALAQTYTPLGNRAIRYASGDFEAEITFDPEGFVNLYEGYLERVA